MVVAALKPRFATAGEFTVTVIVVVAVLHSVSMCNRTNSLKLNARSRCSCRCVRRNDPFAQIRTAVGCRSGWGADEASQNIVTVARVPFLEWGADSQDKKR